MSVEWHKIEPHLVRVGNVVEVGGVISEAYSVSARPDGEVFINGNSFWPGEKVDVYRERGDDGSAAVRMLLWVVAGLAALVALGEWLSPDRSVGWLVIGLIVCAVAIDHLYATRPWPSPLEDDLTSSSVEVVPRPPFYDWGRLEPELGGADVFLPRRGTAVDVRSLDRPSVDEWIVDGLLGRERTSTA